MARVTVLHKHDLTAEDVLKAGMAEVHLTNLLHGKVLLASKLVEVKRCGNRSKAKEAASKLDSSTSCWVVRASLARLRRELDAEGVREGEDSSSDSATGLEMPLNCENGLEMPLNCETDSSPLGNEEEIEKTDDETKITDDREKVHMMETDGNNEEHIESGIDATKENDVTKESSSEVDKDEECHWEPGKVQWLELMEGEPKGSGKTMSR